MNFHAELAEAGAAILRVDHQIVAIRDLEAGIVTPKGLAWDRVRDLANAAEALAYHATWMRNEILKRAQ